MAVGDAALRLRSSRSAAAQRESPRRGVPDQPHDTHIVLLAQDAEGYSNLCRLITDAHMLGERSDPSVTASQICAHAAGSGRAARVRVRRRDGWPSPAGSTPPVVAAEPFREAFGR